MTKPLTKPCDACKGTGVVARTPRQIVIDGVASPDPWDTRREELCAPCGGSGAVADGGPAADPVRAIDHGDCCY